MSFIGLSVTLELMRHAYIYIPWILIYHEQQTKILHLEQFVLYARLSRRD
jgi:hypothetical protein